MVWVPAVFMFPVDIAVHFLSKAMGCFKNFSSRANGLDPLGASLNAGGKFSLFKLIIAPVTFVHDPVSGQSR